MILVCGATGLLGSRVVTRLLENGRHVRALVRPATDATTLQELGAEVVRGDLRDRASLEHAVAGAKAVVSTANTIARTLDGERGLGMRDIDLRGHADLVDVAERAGVERFVYLSFTRLVLDSDSVFARAKLATEERLRRSPMRSVVVRPGMFQEVWLSEMVGLDWRKGRATIFGKGHTPHGYVAVDDVAAAVVHGLEAADPPGVMEFEGPERLSRVEVVEAYERALGREISRRHVPRAALYIGSRVLRRHRPVMSSVMQQTLYIDSHASVVDDTVLRSLGIEPRPASAFIEESAAAGRR